ncbi:DUF5787 family protein [Halorubrum sp. JWXQ-INN 858]|uniref:DUF5787 family protein n=1 Tax=Halorubrum sp. JWXQ-INN 858 TaxID=2690782 RepID=UPI002AA2AAB7|nr:DUF5787 family protein [Halorubrum sp. JWXQ-INN 858]
MRPDAEFGYELMVCRYAELAWHPGEGSRPAIVSRQLGTRERRWDTVVIEVDPAGFAARRALDDRTIGSDLLHVVRHAPAAWAWYRDALPDPGYPWRYVREAVHRAAGRGLVETRRRGNRIEIRRVRPYPDWIRRIVAVENKPDLDRSAADALADQLSHDVDAALADEVWLATETTGERVEPALLRSMPVEAGVLTTDFSGGVDAGAARVAWHPSDLDAARRDGASDPETVTRRLEIAERAYGKGWRSFHDTMRPDCRSFELRRTGRALVPYCAAKETIPTARECSGSCPSFAPEPPGWRTAGWPIEGGPGKGIQRLLRRRRERVHDEVTGRDGGRTTARSGLGSENGVRNGRD